jgi:hypothetical protein
MKLPYYNSILKSNKLFAFVVILIFQVSIIYAQDKVYCVPLAKDGEYGVIDKTGKLLWKVDTSYYKEDYYLLGINYFNQGFLPCFSKSEQTTHFYDTKGKIVKSVKNIKLIPEPHGYFIGEDLLTGETVIFNKKLELLWKKKVASINVLGNDRIVYRTDRSNDAPFTWVNLKTKEEKNLPSSIYMFVTQDRNLGVVGYKDGFCVFTQRVDYADQYGFLDTLGNIKIPATYYGVSNFSDGKAEVIIKSGENNPNAQFIDTDNNLLSIPTGELHNFSQSEFSDGLAPIIAKAAYDEKKMPEYLKQSPVQVGYIDKKGDWKINPRFIEAGSFKYGLALTKEYNGQEFILRIINTKGESIIEENRNSNRRLFGSTYWDENVIFSNNSRKLYDHKGTVIWEAKYPYKHVYYNDFSNEVDYYKIYNLSINYNSTSESPKYDKIQLCNNLRELYLTFSPDLKKELPIDVFNLQTLSVLKIDGKGINSFPKGITKLKNLTKLELLNTSIKTLPADILDLPKLKEVELNSMNELSLDESFIKKAAIKHIKIIAQQNIIRKTSVNTDILPKRN